MAMRILGITGGMGMGKSTVAAVLGRMGIPVVDTDQIARDVVSPGEPALAEIRTAFGPEVFGEDGGLDRAAMARMVFGEPEARRRLETILHPRIRERWMAWVKQGEQLGWKLAAVVIPLLYETGAGGCFDRVVCVACTDVTQRRRLLARGWSLEEIEGRRQAQWPVEQKMRESDYVIWTEGREELLETQLRHILASVLG